jgi:uncharacterized protein (TIGR00369 family)
MRDVGDLMMGREELTEFLDAEFPQMTGQFGIEEVRGDGVTVRLHSHEKHLRPGGTVSGPAMFALVDVAIYLAVLSRVGPKALAVTTNCSIDFMRKPASGKDLIGEAHLLKLGRTLAVGEVYVRSEGSDALVARASLTYSLPPERF